MTVCREIGEFETTIQRRMFLGKVEEKVKLEISWVSYGTYAFGIRKAEDEKLEDFELDTICLTPEWINNTFELYPKAKKEPRNKLYKPFYKDFITDQAMIDTGHDMLFQAFKGQFDDCVTLSVNHFYYGTISERTDVLTLKFDEFKRLKEYLDNPNGEGSEIFYSGCKIDTSGLGKESDESLA